MGVTIIIYIDNWVLGAVLCVRWSPPTLKKSFLASSADDSVVLIWQRNEYIKKTFILFFLITSGLFPDIEIRMLMLHLRQLQRGPH